MAGDPLFDPEALRRASRARLRACARHLEAERYRADPVGWIEGRLGELSWSKQQEIAEAVRDHRHTAVRACHDSGKSWIASRLACWWIDTHAPGEAFVVTTAPTVAQVKAILWREMHRAHQAGKLSGEMNQTEWLLDGELVAFGRKPSDYDQAAFQGIHARHVLVIIDEACGIEESLWTAADTLVTNEGSRLLAIGNPDDPTSHFARVCRPNSGWAVIPISGFDTPNFTDEEVPEALRSLFLSPTWVEERRRRWGEGSPLWVAKVLGEFPDRSEDCLIPLSWVQRAGEREQERGGAIELGVDVARFGSDETVIMARRGGVARLLEARHKDDTMQTAGRVIRALRDSGAAFAKIDDVGVGGGVLDRVFEQGFEVVGMNGGQRSSEPARFANARAEWYWELRTRFERGAIDIDPEDEVLAEQLCSIHYKLNSRGQIQIESKDDMRSRGIGSPDRADALMLCFASPMIERTYLIEYEDQVQISPY